MSSNLIDKIFTAGIKKKADIIVAKYETKRAPLLEILRLLQEEYGYITLEMEQATADYLELAAIDVREVMTFYTLYYDKPKARTRFNVCRTLSCALMGAEDMTKYLEEKLGIRAGEISKDGAFSIQPVECLGACELAPMLQLNDHEFVGCLNKKKIDELVSKAGK